MVEETKCLVKRLEKVYRDLNSLVREYDEIRRRKHRDFRHEDRIRRKLEESKERLSSSVQRLTGGNYEEVSWVQFDKYNTQLHIYFGRGRIGCRPHGHIVIDATNYIITYYRSINGNHGHQNLVSQTNAY